MMTEPTDHTSLVVEILCRCARPPRQPSEVQPEHLLVDDLAIDSLAFIEALIELENEMGVQLDESDLLLHPGTSVETFTARVGATIERAMGDGTDRTRP